MTQKKNMCKTYVSLLNIYSNFVFVSKFSAHMILLKSGQFMFWFVLWFLWDKNCPFFPVLFLIIPTRSNSDASVISLKQIISSLKQIIYGMHKISLSHISSSDLQLHKAHLLLILKNETPKLMCVVSSKDRWYWNRQTLDKRVRELDIASSEITQELDDPTHRLPEIFPQQLPAENLHIIVGANHIAFLAATFLRGMWPHDPL